MLHITVTSKEFWGIYNLYLSLTELEPISTVHVEVVVARLPLAAEGVKYEPVGAESVLGLVVEAVVVFVTLDGVGEVAVLFRTSEV